MRIIIIIIMPILPDATVAFCTFLIWHFSYTTDRYKIFLLFLVIVFWTVIANLSRQYSSGRRPPVVVITLCTPRLQTRSVVVDGLLLFLCDISLRRFIRQATPSYALPLVSLQLES